MHAQRCASVLNEFKRMDRSPGGAGFLRGVYGQEVVKGIELIRRNSQSGIGDEGKRMN